MMGALLGAAQGSVLRSRAAPVALGRWAAASMAAWAPAGAVIFVGASLLRRGEPGNHGAMDAYRLRWPRAAIPPQAPLVQVRFSSLLIPAV